MWTESFKQTHRHYFMFDTDQIPLNFLLNFPLISYHSHIYIVVDWYTHYGNCTNTNSSDLWSNVNQYQTSCILLYIISLLHALHTSSGYLDLFYAHCTHQSTVRSLACNILEVSGRQVQWPNRKCYQTLPQWYSELLNFSVVFYIGTFPISKSLCLKMVAGIAVLT